MTQSEAYELLGNLIGKQLSLNGVHGEDLTKIAEKHVEVKDRLEKMLTGVFNTIIQVLDVPEDGKHVAIVTDGDHVIGEYQAMMLKRVLGMPVLVASPDVEINLKEAVPLVEALFKQLPLLKPALFARELQVLKNARAQLYAENQVAGEIDAILTENGVAR